MEYIAHRINTIAQLRNLSIEYGVEVDLRDDTTGKIYIQHDPFILGDNFEEYLREYHHGTMILNIKSERIEFRVLELMKQYQIRNYFFLDSSFPMIKQLSDIGEQNIALRLSEYEGMDTIRNMKGRVEWVWIDCFSRLPLDYVGYKQLNEMGYKLCLVSPELQGQPEKIVMYQDYLKYENIHIDAVCTKEFKINEWKRMDR